MRELNLVSFFYVSVYWVTKYELNRVFMFIAVE